MKKIFSKKFLIKTLLIAAVYLITINYLMNISLVKNTILGSYPLGYKFRLLGDLLEGMWTVMTHVTLFVLILNSLLTGAILTLLEQKIRILREMGPLHILAGGSTFLSIVGSGCAACGLPILSLLGLSGAVLYLPFKGGELLYISFVLLLSSFYFIAKDYVSIQCSWEQKKNSSFTKPVLKTFVGHIDARN